MKQIVLFAFLTLTTIFSASAQSSDSNSDSDTKTGFQWGLKGGGAMTKATHISTAASTGFTSDRGYGYIGGFWGRVGGPHFYFQPEVYLATRNLILHDTTNIITNGTFVGTKAETNNATFTSVDIPLLIGTKFRFGDTQNGVRINAGPLLSLSFSDQQSTANTTDDFAHVNYKTVNYGWQAGFGFDYWRFALDFRYEGAFNKFNTYDGNQFRFNGYNITLGFNFGSR